MPVTLSSLPDLKSYPISSDNTQITLDSTSKEVTYGDSITLKASVTSGTPQTVTWKSSNTAVATVKDGIVTATGKGTAKITASLPNGRSAVCTVKVTTKKASNIRLFLCKHCTVYRQCNYSDSYC